MAQWDDDWGDQSDDMDTPDVNEILFGRDYDPEAQSLMMAGIMDGNDNAYRDLVDYMWEMYGIDFEDAFDWDDFREWYEAQ
jgi:hypothetical protein